GHATVLRLGFSIPGYAAGISRRLALGARQRSGAVTGARTTGKRIGEIELALLKIHLPVEDHFDGSTFGENRLRAPREHDAGECRSGSRARANRRAHTRRTAHASRQRPDAGSGGSGFSDGLDVARLIPFAADGAFLVVQFLARPAIE